MALWLVGRTRRSPANSFLAANSTRCAGPAEAVGTYRERVMIWLAGAALLLLIALVFNLPLLAYAMYVLLAVLLVSRFLTRRWAESLAATRECNQLSAEIGDTVAVMISVKNEG